MTCSYGTLALSGKLAIIVSNNYYHFDSGMDKNGTVLNFTLLLCVLRSIIQTVVINILTGVILLLTSHTMYYVVATLIL